VNSKEVAENPTLYDVTIVGSNGYAVGDSGAIFISDATGQQWKRGETPAGVNLRWIRAASIDKGGRGLLVGANGLTLRVAGSQISAPETEQHASSASH
jgi:photosystem II stability/assembly factor-like uncharacterized protein